MNQHSPDPIDLKNFKKIADSNMQDIYMSDALRNKILYACNSSKAKSHRNAKNKKHYNKFLSKTPLAFASCIAFGIALALSNQIFKPSTDRAMVVSEPTTQPSLAPPQPDFPNQIVSPNEPSAISNSKTKIAPSAPKTPYEQKLEKDVLKIETHFKNYFDGKDSTFFEKENLLAQFSDVKTAINSGYNVFQMFNVDRFKNAFEVESVLIYKKGYMLLLSDGQNVAGVLQIKNTNNNFDYANKVTPFQDIAFEKDNFLIIISVQTKDEVLNIKTAQEIKDLF